MIGSLLKNSVLLLTLFVCCLAAAQGTRERTAPSSPAAPYLEAQLKVAYERHIDSLNALKISLKYPGAIRLLLSKKIEKQLRGIDMLRATKEVEILPWLVPLVDSENEEVSIQALFAIERLVEYHVLLRRDMSQPEGIYIRALGPDDPDLRPLAWLLLQQFKRGDSAPNQMSYAATMAGYLNLHIFRTELQVLQQSRHVSVQRSATYALQMIREGHLKD